MRTKNKKEIVILSSCPSNYNSCMNKHAYLIYAHSCIENLLYLLRTIDDARNDIYLHIDKKWKDFDFAKCKNAIQKSKIYFLKKRYKVYWGHHSQILAERYLFKCAYKSKEQYSYYHLMSGSDMCIKSQDYIHDFFANQRQIFITFTKEKEWNDGLSYRIGYYHFGLGRTRHFLLKLQKKLHIHRKAFKCILYGGDNWCSLPDYCVRFLLKQTGGGKINKYLFGRCADEIWKQDLIANSELINYVAKIGCLRLIDWNRGRPYTFKKDDFELIKNSTMLFARKFNTMVDRNIMDMILNDVLYH